MRPRIDHPWNLSQDAAERTRAALAAARDPRPAFRAGVALHRALVIAPLADAAGVVAIDWPSGRVRRSARARAPRSSVFLPTAPTFRDAQTVDAFFLKMAEAPDVLIVEETDLRPGAFGLADHLGVRWGVPSVAVSTVCAGEWDEPPPGLDGAHVFVKDGGVPVALAVRARAHRSPLFVAPGHRMDLMGALDIVLSLPLAPRHPWPLALARARAAGKKNPRPGYSRGRKVL